MGAVIFFVVLGLVAAVVLLRIRGNRRRWRSNPAFDVAGRPVPDKCRKGYHDVPDAIVGMEWSEVACWECGMLVYAPPEAVPAEQSVEPWISVAYYGEIYDVKGFAVHYRWSRTATFTLLEHSDAAVKVRVEIEDFRSGRQEYTLSFGDGLVFESSERTLRLEVGREDVAKLLTGEVDKLETAAGNVHVNRPFARRGWRPTDSKSLAAYSKGGNVVGHVPLPPRLLGMALCPWALAVLDDRPVAWPEFETASGELPELVWREAGMDLEHLQVWSESAGDDVVLTQLKLREVDDGAVWRVSDRGVTVNVGTIRRADMRDGYSRNENAHFESMERNGDDPLPDTDWVDSRKFRFPIEPLLAMYEPGWGKIVLTDEDGATLTFTEHKSDGYPFAFGVLSFPDGKPPVPLGVTNQAYRTLVEWTAARAAPAEIHA